ILLQALKNLDHIICPPTWENLLSETIVATKMRLEACIFIVIAMVLQTLASQNRNLLNSCMDTNYHKKEPGNETQLFGECTRWQENGCCTPNTTRRFHETVNQFNFDLSHCYEQTNRTMSEKCKKFFHQDICFYGCEPHVGHWFINVNLSFARERMYKVPLCASVCNEWWNACKKEFTCHSNWPKNYKSIKNHCSNSTCKRFDQVWTSASDFCENVWNHSWKYTNDKEPCMKMSFDPRKGNPNKKVAEHYIKKSSTYYYQMKLLYSQVQSGLNGIKKKMVQFMKNFDSKFFDFS
ncbi:Folate receptor beta-like protein, partial [Dinothrombium tinctorium]